MLVHLVLLQIFCIFSLAVASPSNATTASTKPGCQSRCGNLEIPYPFGIGSNCSLDANFDINCNTSFNPPKPYLVDPGPSIYKYYSSYEVVNISETQIYLKNAEAQLSVACNGMGFDNKTENYTMSMEFFLSPYTLSNANQVTSLGCDDLAMVRTDSSNDSDGGVACASYCTNFSDPVVGSCPGRGCCRTSITKGTYVGVKLSDMHSYWGRDSRLFRCSFAFVGMIGDGDDKFNFNLSHLDDSTTFLNNNKKFMSMPLVLDWGIARYLNCTEVQNSTNFACQKNSDCIDLYQKSVKYSGGYQCRCKKGYEGNPYLRCQDINECMTNHECISYGTCTNTLGSYQCSCPSGYRGDGKRNGFGCFPTSVSHDKLALGVGLSAGMGLLVLLSTCFSLYKFEKKRKSKKSKEKFFKRNGGLLLRQQITTDEGILKKTQLFSFKELEKATDHFNKSRILGEGGQGMVYKGMLSDGKIVAIKKSKVVDENQVEQFINEIVMLSQVIHRNVVKLLGYCLETEVPLLVYEFICNGTLYDHIRDKSDEFPLSWNMRLKIAGEVSEALAYLHSATSIPIYHRDIKSTNILLDEKYVAKVSDFGTSRSIAADHTHLTTLVKGTFGYLDPEYFQSSQFTEKSDVYSFGVVLVELLTGQRPTSSAKTGEERSLATRFLLCMEADNLETILDGQVLEQGKREELIAVAKLAQRCLNLNGKNRPFMKEVAIELEIIKLSQMHLTASDTKYQDLQLRKSKAILASDDDYRWTSTSDNIIPLSDVQPLMIHTV
ncbi:wall-associated receptor kinase 5-like isoform X3 [Olea europaea subsp. europaea]|uniref:Wall-associated receptor kinase 5-like isoform X3 n=1 Tax=Olea europaea subsp. europaea TaxID=158383 RepID=A0A8S0QY06_OLEEU|nr:wall-associated receptor kinase 5-like isoform X3 [Olea europaea subsp. europaea]